MVAEMTPEEALREYDETHKNDIVAVRKQLEDHHDENGVRDIDEGEILAVERLLEHEATALIDREKFFVTRDIDDHFVVCFRDGKKKAA
jgi:hypothetical protein